MTAADTDHTTRCPSCHGPLMVHRGVVSFAHASWCRFARRAPATRQPPIDQEETR